MKLYNCYYNGKLTDEQIKFLECLGYQISAFSIRPAMQTDETGVATTSVTQGITIIDKESFFDSNPRYSWNVAGRINCWDNWKVFSLIAAMEDKPTQYMPVKIESIEDDAPYKVGDIVFLNDIPMFYFVSYKQAELSDILELLITEES